MDFNKGDFVYISEGLHKDNNGIIIDTPSKESNGNYVVALNTFLHGVWVKPEYIQKGYGDSISLKNALANFNEEKEYPKNIDPYEYFTSQLRVNNKAGVKYGLTCDIYPREGNIPHFHITFDKDKNKMIAYICINEATYAPQHKKNTKILNNKEKKDLIKYLNSETGSFHYNGKHELIPTTSWYSAYEYWIDFHPDEDIKKYFKFDDNGDPIMPDYSKL